MKSLDATATTNLARYDSAADVLLRQEALSRPGPFLRLLHAGAPEEPFSYSEVIASASRWRTVYTERGLRTGDRIVIILKHSLDLYGSFLGAILGGFVPAMFAFPSPKFSERAYFDTIGQLLDNAQPRLLIAFSELLPKLSPWVGRCASLDTAIGPDAAAHVAPCADDPPAVSMEDTAFLQYSSGTTGLRKGVAISHRALLWQVREYARSIDLRPNDVIVTWLPLYHDMGLLACFLMPFLTGTRLVALSAFDWVKRPSMLLKALTDHRGTLCWLPNFAYNFLSRAVSDGECEGLELGHVRGLVNCSEPVMAESHRVFLERFRHVGLRAEALAVSYAMAENTFAVTSGGFGLAAREDWIDARAMATEGRAVPSEPGALSSRLLLSCGKPLAETVVEIVDPGGETLPDRRVGEIVVRSPCLLREYFRNEADTARAIRQGRLFTGDLGYVAEGHVYVTGRAKDMIIVGGQNVFPQDVEAIVNEVPGVLPGRCVALGLLDPSSGTEALIVIAEAAVPAGDERRGRIQQAIASAISTRTDVVASDVLLVDHMWLHKSSSGKIARAENLRRYLELTRQKSGEPAPMATELATSGIGPEEVLRAVRRVLDRTPSNRGRSFGPRDPIISSGAIDSFGMVDLLLELERTFGLRIPDGRADVENLDTAERIAQTLCGLTSLVAESPDVPQRSDEVLLTSEHVIPAGPGSAFWTLYYRALFKALGIRYGANFQVKGALILRLGKRPENLTIGDQVLLMPGVDLKLRDGGRIVIGNGTQLDTSVRIVAANDATVAIGDNARVGLGTIINAGADLTVGRDTLVAAYCVIDTSEHRFDGRASVMSQGYVHAPVLIGEETWIGARSFIEMGSRIGRGAIVGVGSVVNGDITAYGVAMGTPARIIKMRR